ncbi:MAG: ATP-binding protein [Oscillospiraceae bacterium]|jgi:predicted ATP-binding protein involved in virulence|nr:ATP-binding protein [Oscillospiraceae bacterium]
MPIVVEIYIDGFKNITNTTLRLKEPITVLLAPNNFGKTNVINAIEYAAMIVNTIPKRQEMLILKNGYTSINEDNEPRRQKSFKFDITINDNTKTIIYSFKVSPAKGVEYEALKVGHANIFNREGTVGYINNQKLNAHINQYNLFISVPIYIENSEKNKKQADVIKYIDLIRDVFFNMSDMLCNRQSMTHQMTPNEKINSFEYEEAIADEVHILKEIMPAQYNRFRSVFKRLFPYIKDFRIVSIFYGEGDNSLISDRPDAYRLEFDTIGKHRPETFRHLSEGTRDIFLLLLTIFLKPNKPFLAIEEIENGIHPSLYRKVLNLLADMCKNTRLLITTHSPSIVRNFDNSSFSTFYVGIPNNEGNARFATFKDAASNEISNEASENGTSAGEIIFDMMLGTKSDIKRLKEWLDV